MRFEQVESDEMSLNSVGLIASGIIVIDGEGVYGCVIGVTAHQKNGSPRNFLLMLLVCRASIPLPALEAINQVF